MKLKYYLRGLGLGILVTTLILTIANGKTGTISDEEVIRRAAKLGMVKKEDTLFPDKESTADASTEKSTEKVTGGSTEEPSSKQTEAVTEPETEKQTEKATEPATEEATKPVTVKPTEPVTEESTEPVTEEPTEPVTEEPTEPVTEKPDDSGIVTATIVIKSGMFSEAVSQNMQKAGLISNWVDFNDFLSSRGYDERLQTGRHTLNSGMSYEEMALILMS